MGNGGKTKASGVLKNYLEDSGLVEFEDGEASSGFEHVRPEDRDPDGFFDYVLQSFVDFGSKEMGGPHVLEFSTDREVFDTYTKVQSIDSSLLNGSLMDRYGFDLEDPYMREGFNAGKTELGNSISTLVDRIDYDGKVNTIEEMSTEKALQQNR